MKKFLTVLFCSFYTLLSCAQVEYYLNEHKQQTDSAHAVYKARVVLQGDGADHGIITITSLNGNVISEAEYKNMQTAAIPDGITKLYHPNGKLKAEISYKNGLLHGAVKTYYNTGNIKRNDVFDKGALQQGECFTMNGMKGKYHEFYTPPSYIGGERALYKFVFLNTYYPDDVKLEKITGTVLVRLVISKKGDVIERSIVQPLQPELDKEALRVAHLITKFNPARQDGEPIESVYMLSVPFEIRD
jgi:protein TonB